MYNSWSSLSSSSKDVLVYVSVPERNDFLDQKRTETDSPSENVDSLQITQIAQQNSSGTIHTSTFSI